MPRVICSNYTRYYDQRSGLEFAPVLDRRSNHYVGMVEAPDALVHHFEKREHFEILTDGEYAAATQAPPAAPKDAPQSGDPLTDIAQDNPDAARLNELVQMGFKGMKPIAAEHGINILGRTLAKAAALILDAEKAKAPQSNPEQPAPALPSGPPVPPSSED